MKRALNAPDDARFRRGLRQFLSESPSPAAARHRNRPLFPALRSGLAAVSAAFCGRRRHGGIVGLALLLPLPLGAATLSDYTIEVLTGLPPSPGNALRLNDHGDVISGNAIYANGVVTSVSIVGKSSVWLTDINNHGQVTGYATALANPTQGFVWQGGSVSKWLPAINGDDSWAYGINNNGDVVGYSDSSPSILNFRATLWQAGGGTTDLGTVGTDNASLAYAINDLGQVAALSLPANGSGFGQDAFRWQSGGVTALPGTLGAVSVIIGDINGSGQIVGQAYGASQTPFLSDAITTVTLTGISGQTPYGINDSGLIVGGTGGNAFAFLDGDFAYLEDLVPDLSGWNELTSAYDVNELGQIVGIGRLSNNVQAVFLLSPIPEPSTPALLAAVVTCLVARRRRR